VQSLYFQNLYKAGFIGDSMVIYEPREDSYLLQKWVKMDAFGDVLDMGTGSGIQAMSALDKADSVLAVDIDDEVVESMKKKAEGIDKLEVKKSDLFRALHDKFDVIIFNPPYLPKDVELEDNTIYGGKEGYEILENFLVQAKNYLKDNGFILFLFSSLTNKPKVDRVLDVNKYSWLELDKKEIEFESLYVYRAWL